MKYESKLNLTGNLFEAEQIGEVDTKNPEYQKALRAAQAQEAKVGKEGGYIRFRAALELAKKFQPSDPTNPEKPFGRELRIALQDILNLDAPEDYDRVKFYTAVGTPLDKFHGVDAFVEFEKEDKETKRVDVYRATFDFTTNPQKQVYKSDIVVQEKDLPDPKLESEDFLKAVEGFAKQVAEKIAEQERIK
jgi:hypothetical protein